MNKAAEYMNTARIRKCGLGESSHSNGGTEGADGVGLGLAVPPPHKNFGMFSFEIVHFDAFWNTLYRPTIIAIL